MIGSTQNVQGSLLPLETPESVIEQAERDHGPFIARYALVSGGRDSSVLAHRCRDAYDTLAFVDTGTALPGTVEHVAAVAEWVGKPLVVLATPRNEYDRLVLGSDDLRAGGTADVGAGFPGPALHGSCYTRLKERQLEVLTREAKVGHPRSARVLLLTGVRRAESMRRRSRPSITRKGARTLVNPLIDWTNSVVADYAESVGVPVSDASTLLHRSGECNCGAFAAPGEREMLLALYPEWFADRIAPLERAAADAGYGELATWGHGIRGGRSAPPAEGICSACETLDLGQ